MIDSPDFSIINTGFVEQVDNFVNKVPEYDSRSGEHFWMIVAVYRWNPRGDGKTLMDHESLASVNGPGCYHCEQPYSPLLATRRCKGEPK